MRQWLAGVAVLGVLMMLAAPAMPQSGTAVGCPGLRYPLRSTGMLTFTVGSSSTALPNATMATSVMAVLIVETQPIRFRSDRSAASATVGTFWAKSTSTFQNPLVLCGATMQDWRAVQDTSAGGAATVNAETFGTILP